MCRMIESQNVQDDWGKLAQKFAQLEHFDVGEVARSRTDLLSFHAGGPDYLVYEHTSHLEVP
jgi:hypothetical protein